MGRREKLEWMQEMNRLEDEKNLTEEERGWHQFHAPLDRRRTYSDMRWIERNRR